MIKKIVPQRAEKTHANESSSGERTELLPKKKNKKHHRHLQFKLIQRDMLSPVNSCKLNCGSKIPLFSSDNAYLQLTKRDSYQELKMKHRARSLSFSFSFARSSARFISFF